MSAIRREHKRRTACEQYNPDEHHGPFGYENKRVSRQFANWASDKILKHLANTESRSHPVLFVTCDKSSTLLTDLTVRRILRKSRVFKIPICKIAQAHIDKHSPLQEEIDLIKNGAWSEVMFLDDYLAMGRALSFILHYTRVNYYLNINSRYPTNHISIRHSLYPWPRLNKMETMHHDKELFS